MYKKLTSKTQFLNPNLPESASGFAKTMSIEPESEDALLRRGTIYAVFEALGGSGYNTSLITKIVHDVLHDSYFQSQNISPTQSLEKAVSEVKDKVLRLSNESIHADSPQTEFNIIAGVLWGNVMYVVVYGNAQSYLVRGGDIKPINTISEGTFSAASGVVKDGDVIIFCSQEFGRKYPPDKLLTMAIGEQELLPQEACVLMKFIVDTTFSPNETIDFGLADLPKQKETPKIFKKLAGAFSWVKKIRLPKFERHKKDAIETIGYLGNTGIKVRSQNASTLKKLLKPWVMILLIAIALGVSVTLSYKGKSMTNTKTENVQDMPKPVVEGTQTNQQETDSAVFYDLKIADPLADPSSLAVFNKVVVVADRASGKVFISDQNSAKFEPITAAFLGISNLVNIKGQLGFTDNEGYKVYDIAGDKIVENYKQTGLGVTNAYLDFVYSLSESKLLRYSKNTDTLTESLWGQTASFEGAKSMAIAYSIFVVTKGGTVEKYSGGAKETFEITGVTLNNPTQVFADVDLENIYVADSERVVSLSEDGKLVKEYKPTKDGAWNDIRAIGISPDEKILFVLNGSRVFKVSL